MARTSRELNPALSTSILDLPVEVIAKIVSFIDPVEALETLPLVCSHLHDVIMRDRIPWTTLDFRRRTSRQNTTTVRSTVVKRALQLAQFDTRCLLLPNVRRLDDPRKIMRSVIRIRWEKLTTLAVPFFKGLQKLNGSVPNLHKLTLEAPFGVEDWMWEEVAKIAAFPKLEHLTIKAQSFHWPQHLQFAALVGPLFDKLESITLSPVEVEPNGDTGAFSSGQGDSSLFGIFLGPHMRAKTLELTTEFCLTVSNQLNPTSLAVRGAYRSVEKLSLRSSDDEQVPGSWKGGSIFDPSFGKNWSLWVQPPIFAIFLCGDSTR
jgi:hypothetical protein